MIGNSTVISYSTTGSGDYTPLAKVVDANIPEETINKVETSSYDTEMDSLSGNSSATYESSGWIEQGDIELDVVYTKAGATAVYAQKGIEQFWKLTLKDGSGWAFPGFLSKLGGTIPMKDQVRQKLTIAVTGKVTFTPGA